MWQKQFQTQIQLSRKMNPFFSQTSYCDSISIETEQLNGIQLEEECHFCSGVNITRCMMISVTNKHNEEPNFYTNIINKLVEKQAQSPLNLKYQQLIRTIDEEEHVTRYYGRKEYRVEMREMLEYYKYRKFVPVFGDLRLGKILHAYYYSRLKLYYNEIKKQLNLTIEPSSSSSLQSSSGSNTVSPDHQVSKILHELTTSFKFQQQTTGPTFPTFKNESKALEDLVNYLKSNEKFKYVTPLRVQSQWEKIKKTSKEMFRDIVMDKKREAIKNTKSKIFITFFSRDDKTVGNEGTKSPIKVMKSEKLVKSKDLKALRKDNEMRMLGKLERIKNQILEQKINQKAKTQSKQKTKTSQVNLTGRKTPLRFFQSDRWFDQERNKNLEKIRNQEKIARYEKNRKSIQKISINQQSHRNNDSNQQVQRRKTPKVRKSYSESKLKQPVTLLKCKTVSKLGSQHGVKGKQFTGNIQKSPNCLKPVISQQKQRALSGRKSVDLTKLPQSSPQKNIPIQALQVKDYLTQKYQNLILPPEKDIAIRTANVSPTVTKVNKERSLSRGERNAVVMQKGDNILSMKKKKLDLLKRKVEMQKTAEKK